MHHNERLVDLTLHWRHHDHDIVSNHQPHHCLLNRLFRRRSRKTSKLRVTGYAENVSIWWRHHDIVFNHIGQSATTEWTERQFSCPNPTVLARDGRFLLKTDTGDSYAGVRHADFVYVGLVICLVQLQQALYSLSGKTLPQDLVKSRSYDIRV